MTLSEFRHLIDHPADATLIEPIQIALKMDEMAADNFEEINLPTDADVAVWNTLCDIAERHAYRLS